MLANCFFVLALTFLPLLLPLSHHVFYVPSAPFTSARGVGAVFPGVCLLGHPSQDQPGPSLPLSLPESSRSWATGDEYL
jgi:hypothetical protein